jgi:hypothetical protein
MRVSSAQSADREHAGAAAPLGVSVRIFPSLRTWRSPLCVDWKVENICDVESVPASLNIAWSNIPRQHLEHCCC